LESTCIFSRAAGKNKQADREQAEVNKLHGNAAP